jgi:transcriptional regulator with XRE-family HTH domain
MSDIGERVRALRSARSVSQAALAAALGVSKSYLSHIEAGRRPVSSRMLAQLAQTLGVDVSQLEEGVPPDVKEELQLKLRFAELSLRNGDWDLAGREFARVLQVARTLPLQPLVDEATWGKARADEASGLMETAIESYEWLVERPRLSAAVSPAAVSVALVRAYSECGDLGRAIDIGERAVSGIGAEEPRMDAGAQVELVSTLAGCYLERGDLMRAQLLINRALDDALADGSPRARAAAAWNAAVIADAKHDVAAARIHADRALALYSEIDNARAVGLLRVVSAGLRLREERPDPYRALPELDRAVADLSTVGTRLDLGYAHTEQARAHLLAGDAERAAELGRQALDDLVDGDRLQRGRTLVVVGQAAAALHDEESALNAYRQAVELLRAAGASRQAASSWRELGEAYVALGRSSEAIDALRQASDLAGATYNPVRTALDATAGQTVR